MITLRTLWTATTINFFVWVFVLNLRFAEAQTAPAVFHPVGVGGGGALYNLSFNPKNPADFWVETDMGELFHTADNGVNWTYPDLEKLQGYHESKIQWTNVEGTIYVQESNGIPKKSVDGGKTWTTLPGWDYLEQSPCRQVRVDVNNANRVFGLGAKGIFYSSDGGVKFRKIWDNTNDKLFMAGLFSDGQRLWLGTNVGVLTSTDGGATWARMAVEGIPTEWAIGSFAGARQGATVRLWAVALEPQGIAPITMDGQLFPQFKGVYRMNVGDNAWTNVTASLPHGHYPVFVGLANSDPSVVWLGGAEKAARDPANPGYIVNLPSMLRSTDGGVTWTSTLQWQGNANVYTNWYGTGADYDWEYAGSVFTMSVSDGDPKQAGFTNFFGVWGTSDGGQTWRSLVAGTDNLNKPGVTNVRNAYYGSTLNNTASWHLNWLDEKTIFASSNDILAFRSIDGGKTWQFPQVNGARLNATYKTTYDAKNKRLYAAMSAVHDLYVGDYMSDARVESGPGAIYYSKDQGATWSPLHAFASASQGGKSSPVVNVELDPNAPNRMYALVANHLTGGIYRTDDLDRGENATWIKLPNPPRTEGHPWDIKILANGSLVVTYAGRLDQNFKMTPSSGVFISTNGGQTWEDRTAPADQSSMRFNTQDIVIDPWDSTQSTWYATVAYISYLPDAWPDPKVGLFKTTDSGKTWMRIFNEVRVGAHSLAINAASGEFYLATNRGLWYGVAAGGNAPKFAKVPDVRYPSATRVFLNPYKPSEVWVVTFGAGIMWGDATESSDAPKPAGSAPQLPGGIHTVTPITGSAAVDTFTTLTFSTSQALPHSAEFVIQPDSAGATPSQANACSAAVYTTGALLLADNAGQYTNGNLFLSQPWAGSRENSQCLIDGINSSTIISTGSTIAFTVRLKFKSTWAGRNLRIFVRASNTSYAYTAWQQPGTFTVTGGSAPQLPGGSHTVTPITGSAAVDTFTTLTFSTSQALPLSAEFVIQPDSAGATPSQANACSAAVYTTGALLLADNAGQYTNGNLFLSQPWAGFRENSQCLIDGINSSTIISTGSTITFTVRLKFKSTWAGRSLRIFVRSSNTSYIYTAWQQPGTFAVTAGSGPQLPVGSHTVTPASGGVAVDTFTTLTFATSQTSPLSAEFVIQPDSAGASPIMTNACSAAAYTTGALLLADNAGQYTNGNLFLSQPWAGSRENSQCLMDGVSSSTVISTGSTITFTVRLKFKSAWAGRNLRIFVRASNTSYIYTAWQQPGTFTVTAGSAPQLPVGSHTVTPASGGVAVDTFTTLTFATSQTSPLSAEFVIQPDSVGASPIMTNTCAAAVYYSGALLLADNSGQYTNGNLFLSQPWAGSRENSQCLIDGVGSTAVISTGSTITFTVRLKFKSAWAGRSLRIFVRASNTGYAYTAWQQPGTFTVQ